MKLKPCPECESEFITDEDALIKKWNKLKRNNF